MRVSEILRVKGRKSASEKCHECEGVAQLTYKPGEVEEVELLYLILLFLGGLLGGSNNLDLFYALGINGGVIHLVDSRGNN